MGTAIRTNRGTVLALGAESSWGTEVARDATARVVSCTLQRKLENVALPHLAGVGFGRVRDATYTAKETYGGETVHVAQYEGGTLGLLLYAALGSKVDAGAGPYTHTLTVSDGAPVSLSSELKRGNENGAADKTEEGYGLICTDWEFSVSGGKHAEWRATWVGKNGGARGSAGTFPTIDTPYPILHSHCGQLSFNSVSYTIASLKIKGSNKQATDIHELGTTYITEPPIGDFAEYTVEAEIYIRDASVLYAAHLAKTQSDVAVTFTDSTRSLAWTVHNCEISSYDDGISDVGPMKAKVTWTAMASSGKSGVSVVLTNAKTTTVLS